MKKRYDPENLFCDACGNCCYSNGHAHNEVGAGLADNAAGAVEAVVPEYLDFPRLLLLLMRRNTDMPATTDQPVFRKRNNLTLLLFAYRNRGRTENLPAGLCDN